MATQAQQVARQEGSRWINRRPTGDELARWFSENVPLHDGMAHTPFLPGITLIPNKEKVREPRIAEDGTVAIVDVEQLVYVPYPMVDTRVNYWWTWRLQHPEWEATLKPLPREKQSDHLPEGFWQFPIADPAGKVTPFIAVTYHALMRGPGRNGAIIVEGYGTKVVPLLVRRWNGVIVPDENAIAKAETGAKGRALGAAGILLIPGAGVATAEDMLDFLATSQDAAPALEPTLPPPVTEPAGNGDRTPATTTLPQIVHELATELLEQHPAAYEEAAAWAREKGYDIAEPPETALRGLERVLRRKLDAAKAAGAPAQA